MVRHGDAFWMCPRGDEIEHLFIVVSNPDIDPTNVVLIPVTTRDEFADESCMLYSGDHQRIRHDSCMDYRRARIVSAHQIDKAMHLRQIRRVESVRDEIIERILVGAAQTRQLPGRCDKILHSQSLID